MKVSGCVVGQLYQHKLDGVLWHVRVTSVEYDKDQQRHLWTGKTAESQNGLENGSACWGWVSELRPVTDGAESDIERERRG